MDQQISSRGSMVGAAITLFCGIAMLPVGIGMVVSMPDKIWPLGLVLVVAGVVVIIASVKTFRKSEKDLKKAEQTSRNLTRNAVLLLKQKKESSELSNPAADTKPTVPELPSAGNQDMSADKPLSVWTCTPDEWKQFYQWEIQDRRLQAWATGLVFTFIGGIAIMFIRQAAWYVAFPFAAFIGWVYGMLSFRFFLASIGKNRGTAALIVFTADAVMINNKLNPFRSDLYRLGGVRIDDKQELKVMIITYNWNTARGGDQSDDIHVPIPKGKLGDAIRLMDYYNSGLKK